MYMVLFLNFILSHYMQTVIVRNTRISFFRAMCIKLIGRYFLKTEFEFLSRALNYNCCFYLQCFTFFLSGFPGADGASFLLPRHFLHPRAAGSEQHVRGNFRLFLFLGQEHVLLRDGSGQKPNEAVRPDGPAAIASPSAAAAGFSLLQV